LLFSAKRLERLRLETPEINYALRKMRTQDPKQLVNWKLGAVSTY
jgi:hypothetical protein